MSGVDGPSRTTSVDPADPSWWFSDALAQESWPTPYFPFTGTHSVDVAIVGGGYTGLWTALALKQRSPSLSVAIIEANLCGSGASGKNGGKVHGYWAALPAMANTIGDDGALAVARAGTIAQDAIRDFVTNSGHDVWWREDGNMRVSTAPAQDIKIQNLAQEALRLGVADTLHVLSPAEVAMRCRSPVFRGGVFLPEGANVHPARLVRALRIAAIENGVLVFENTPMIGLDRGNINRVRTPRGELLACDVVLATNVDMASAIEVKPHISVFSSYAVMSEPAPAEIAEMGWLGDEGIADFRMFVHYFRKTRDGRVLMGSGSGPISHNGNAAARKLREDRTSAARAERGLRRLLPALSKISLAKAWGGAIDVSSDRLPFFKTIPGTRIHFGCGYSGHGVNPTYIGGQCLASLVLGTKDMWSALPLCTRDVPRLPPEPFRYIGAAAIRRAIIACEEAEERQEKSPAIAELIARLPGLLGMRIGTR